MQYRSIYVLIAFLAFFTSFAFADFTFANDEKTRFTPEVTGSITSVNPSLWGWELGLSYLGTPLPERDLWIGPRIGTMWITGSNPNRFDFQMGVESMIWIANAIGTGLQLDWIAPSSQESSHFRFSPSISVRIARVETEGAWAIRFAVPYDSSYRWEAQLGVSLQFSGVSVVSARPVTQ